MKEKYIEMFTKNFVKEYNNHAKELGKETIVEDQVIMPWFAKELQNTKCTMATNIKGDHIYAEMTYNGDKDQLYTDFYSKLFNKAINSPFN